MSSSSRLAPLARLAPAMLMFAFAATLAAGCEDKHIGRPCLVGVDDDGGAPSGGTTATINPAALECPSRICLAGADQNNANLKPLCTADCSSDGDCDGETDSNPANGLCKTGFACLIATTVGDFCCRSLCVCKDLVSNVPNARKTPQVCLPGMGSTCKNVH